MRALTRIVLALALPAATSAAQEASPALPQPEIGFRSGIMRLTPPSSLGDPLNVVVIPGGNAFSPNGVHFTFFVSPRVALEPHLGLTRTSTDDASNSLLYVALQPEFYTGPDVERSPYIFGQVGFLRQSSSFSGGSDSDTRSVYGAGVGYRRVVRRSVALRYELRVRRIEFGVDESFTEVGFMFGIGAVIGRKSP